MGFCRKFSAAAALRLGELVAGQFEPLNPMLKIVDAMIIAADRKILTLQSRPTVTIDGLFPDSPRLRESLKQMFPVLPQITDLLYSTSQTGVRIQKKI